MNIYDFDGTIYEGDTCIDIVKYGLVKYPLTTIKSLVKAVRIHRDYKKGLVPFERVKEEMLSFIFKTKDYNEFINNFVNTHMKNIKPWYKDKQTDKDVIVSASYELWLNVFAENLGIKYVIGTKTDEFGKIIGNNCKRSEKITRIKEMFPNEKIFNSYSDSSVDIPILELAENGYVVEGNELKPYMKGYKFKYNK